MTFDAGESQADSITASQQVDVPKDAAEDARSMRGVKDSEVVDRINALAKVGQDRASGRYRTIRSMWDLYLDRWSWEGKARWQSKVWIPRLWQVTESAIALYTRGLKPSERWFNLQDEWRGDYRRVWLVENIQHANARMTKLYEQMRLFLMAGFIGGTIPVKVGVDSTKKIPDPAVALLDPLDVALDPSGRDRWIITETEVDPWTLREWGELGMFEQERVDDVLREIEGEAAKDRAERKMEWDEMGPTVTLREFYGDLASRDGELWAGNATGIVANGRHLLRPLMDNPFHKRPIILGQPLRVAHKVWAPGLLEHVSGLARMLTELACAILDMALLASVQGYQYDVDRIDPVELLRGLYPGKLLGVEGLSSEGDALRAFEAGELKADVVGVMEMLDLQIDRGSGIVTEHTTGQARPGGRRKTAREIDRYLGQSLAMVHTMARDLEVSFLEPLLDMILSVYAQVTARDGRAFFRPGVVKAVGPQTALMLAKLKHSKREEILTRDMIHEVHGLSGALAVAEDLQRLLALVSALRMDPETWMMVRKRELAEQMIELHRQDPDKLLYSEQEVQQMAQRQAQQAAMMQRGAMGPAGVGPGARGVTPRPGPPGVMPQALRQLGAGGRQVGEAAPMATMG